MARDRSARTNPAAALHGIAWLVCVLHANTTTAADAQQSREIPTITVREHAAGAGPRALDYLKLPLNSRDSPVAVETIERSLIDNSAYKDLDNLLDVASSALTVGAEGNRTNDITVRGFSGTPLYRNGINAALVDGPQNSTFNIERIEILKGPDGALLGPGEAGGAINIVTKQPLRHAAHRFVTEFGSSGARNFSLDTTGPAGLDDALRYRLVAAREEGELFRDFVRQDSWFVAPSLAWQLTPALDVVSNIEWTGDQALHDTGIVLVAGLPPLPAARFLGEAVVGTVESQGFTSQTTATLVLARSWSMEFQLQGQFGSLDGMGIEPDGFSDEGELERELTASDNSGAAWVAQLEVSGPTTLWGQHHDFVFGVEATRLEESVNYFVSNVDENALLLAPGAPRYGQPLPALSPERQSLERRRQLSAYGQDLWRLAEHWQLLGAVRVDGIRQEGFDVPSAQSFNAGQTAANPRVSLVHTSTIGVTWYGTYSQAIEPNEGVQPDGRPLSPTTAKTVESGLRYTPNSGAFTLDGALFGIRQRDVTVTAPGAPGFEVQTAGQRSVGADVELRVLPLHGFMLSLQYHWLDTALHGDPLLPTGTAALNAPRHQAGILALYEASSTVYGPLMLGIAARYVGQRNASLDADELNLRLSDYTRVDLFARCQVQRHISAQLRIENVLDQNYIRGSDGDALHLQPGAPIAVYGQLSISF